MRGRIHEKRQGNKTKMKLSIIVPIYNEKNTIRELARRVSAVDLGKIKKEIILVDDCSRDGSREILKKLKGGYKKIFHKKNSGKGAALKTGINAATGDFTIFQDADLEYDPNDYKTLLNYLMEKNAGVVIGTRFKGKKFALFGKKKTIHSTHWIGNKFLTSVFNIFYNVNLTDIEPCYKLFKSDVLKSVDIKTNGFEYDIELLCKLVKKGVKIHQIPISYSPRRFEEGKKINWKDGIIAFWIIVKQRFV